MYEIRVQDSFYASHQLRLYDRAWEPLHAHHWKVEVVFRGPRLDSIDVLIDFEAVKTLLRSILAPWEHTRLNDQANLAGSNPSAEVVAQQIFEAMRHRLGQSANLLAQVRVEEAAGCVASYISDVSERAFG